MSVAVMENMEERPQEQPVPFLETRPRDKFGPGSKSGVALKDVLKLSPFALDGTLSADMLPPSPSVNAAAMRSFPLPVLTARGNQAISPTTPSSLVGERPTFSDLQPPGPRRGLSISPLPYTTPQTLPQSLPPILPLDLPALLRSRKDTHNQLAKTVEDLSTCLQVVEKGLDDMLGGTFGGIIEEDYEEPDYSPQSDTR